MKYIFEKYAIALPPKEEYHKILGNVFLSGDTKIIPLQHPASVLYNHSMKEVLTKSYRTMKVELDNGK